LAYFCDRAVLAPTNVVVDSVNAQLLKSFDPASLHTYMSEDDIDAAPAEERSNWPLDFLHSLTPSGMPPHELTLVPGALIMLLRNLDADAGLCNGVRAIVVHCTPRVLDVKLVSGTKIGSRVYIPRVSLAPKNPDLPFVLRRRQFPVKLAWAMTLNKAQGQTLKRVGLYLPSPVFSHGQLYVGLSRAGSMTHVKVLVLDEATQGRYCNVDGVPDGVYTDNVVWPEALLERSAESPDAAADDGAMQVAAPARVASSTNLGEQQTDENWDELSGVPLTPRGQSMGAESDDVLEFGGAASYGLDTDAYLFGAVEGEPIDLEYTDPVEKGDELSEADFLRLP